MLRANNISNTGKQANNGESKMFLPQFLPGTGRTQLRNTFRKRVSRWLLKCKKC